MKRFLFLFFATLFALTTWAADYTIVFSPENGGTETLPESGLKEFVISCEDGISMSSTGSNRTWALRDGDGNGVSTKSIASSDDGKSLTITLASTITTAGTYSLAYSNRGSWITTIPAGTFLLGPDQVESGEMSYSFTLVEEDSGNTGDQDFEYTVDPEEGTITESFDVITLESEVMFVGTAGGGLRYEGTVNVYKDGDTEPYTTSKSIGGDVVTWTDAADTYLIITLEKEISEAGEYEVVIPAGTFYWFNNDSPVLNEEITLNYTFEGNSGTGDDGDHEGDYLTPEIMGFDMSSSSAQTITYEGAPSGTVYKAYTHITNNDTYVGDFNISNNKEYIQNSTSVGYLRKVIFEADERSTDSRTLSVRASNEPYTGSTYNNFSSYGEEVGEISFPAGGTLELSGDYEYFAVSYGSNEYSSNIRFKSIELVWETEDGGNSGSGLPEGYTVSPVEGEVESLTEIIFACADGKSLTDNGISYTPSLQEQFTVVNDETGETVATYGSLDEIEVSADVYQMGIVLSAAVTEAGNYTVNVPAGAFFSWSDFESNPAFTLSYTVTGVSASHEVTFDPESGTTHSELSEFTVICEDGLAFNENNAITITRDGVELDDIYVNAWEITDGTKVTMDFSTDEWGEYSTSLTEAGEYVITIPAKFFILGDDEVESEELTITYIIEGSEEPIVSFNYVVDPEEGKVDDLSVITLTGEDVDGFLGNYEYAAYTTEALVYNRSERGDAITTATLKGAGDVSDDYDTSIIITLNETITDPGSYVVVIPEGSFYVFIDDEPYLNEEIDLSYYIEAPQGEYTFYPADKAELTSLSEFTVYYEGGIACSWNYVGYITVYDENKNYVAYDVNCEENESEDDPSGDYVSCTVTLNTEIVADGTYTITIPEGYFIVGENYANSKELVITYYIKTDAGTETGIGGISINDENVEGIYSTSGQKLNKTQKGVNIIRYTDGSVKKLHVK